MSEKSFLSLQNSFKLSIVSLSESLTSLFLPISDIWGCFTIPISILSIDIEDIFRNFIEMLKFIVLYPDFKKIFYSSEVHHT